MSKRLWLTLLGTCLVLFIVGFIVWLPRSRVSESAPESSADIEPSGLKWGNLHKPKEQGPQARSTLLYPLAESTASPRNAGGTVGVVTEMSGPKVSGFILRETQVVEHEFDSWLKHSNISNKQKKFLIDRIVDKRLLARTYRDRLMKTRLAEADLLKQEYIHETKGINGSIEQTIGPSEYSSYRAYEATIPARRILSSSSYTQNLGPESPEPEALDFAADVLTNSWRSTGFDPNFTTRWVSSTSLDYVESMFARGDESLKRAAVDLRGHLPESQVKDIIERVKEEISSRRAEWYLYGEKH